MRLRLRRRGVDHGSFTVRPRDTSWDADEPQVWRRLFTPPAARRSLALLAALRAGADLPSLRPIPGAMSVSQNTTDPLELHKVHISGPRRELYIKVNWLSTWPGDASLRLRFSYGAEILDDWLDDPVSAAATVRLCEGLFPEARIVTTHRRLRSWLRKRVRSPRFIQPIIYSNAANGGALFHHDYVPRQRGVCFAQFTGRTAWLALSKRRLAGLAREFVKMPEKRLLDRLEHPTPRLERLLNATPAFTRRLADEGWLFVLEPGDAMLMPSRTLDDTIWHSVFHAGGPPSLALSVGVAEGSLR